MTAIRAIRLAASVALALLAGGCAATAPDAQVREALAPTGKRRVGLVARSASEAALGSELKHAVVVRGRDLSTLIHALVIGDADVIGAQKSNLYNIAPLVPGCRVLDGRAGSEEQALAIPKGRNAVARVYLRSFVQAAKRSGLVRQAVERAGVRGVAVTP